MLFGPNRKKAAILVPKQTQNERNTTVHTDDERRLQRQGTRALTKTYPRRTRDVSTGRKGAASVGRWWAKVTHRTVPRCW